VHLEGRVEGGFTLHQVVSEESRDLETRDDE
jgi:hypothetical protein